MSNPLEGSSPTSTRRDDLRIKLQRIRRARRSGMFGPAEVLALGGSAVILLAVLLSYFYFLVPARSNLQARQMERSRLQNQLRSSQELRLQEQDTQTTVDKINASLVNFEDNRLANRNQGRMGLYDELNQLIRKEGLRNTSGPSYSQLEPLDSKKTATGSKATSAKWQSVYPGIGVSLTVEGSYQNLRRFIRSLEVSKQFIIINAIELERATENNAAANASGGGARASLVSLRLDMATYFQRTQAETGPEVQ
jgi:Tfp pilus assembly protein PilO